MSRKPDVAGIIAGTALAGGATIWMLHNQDVVASNDLGLSVALLLVLSGILGLAASGKS
jgi:sulfopyruvate decarboxylase TPP-binding subunit